MPQDRSRTSLSPARQPFLYLTAALLAGILADRLVEPSRLILITIVVISMTAWIKLMLGKKAAAWAILLVSFAAVGALLSRADRTNKPASRLENLYESQVINSSDPVELTGVLAAPPEPAPNCYYIDVDAHSIRVRDEVMPATGRVRLMISMFDDEARAEFNALALDCGAGIRVLVRLERARSYSNPGSPDFNDFLERHGYDLKGVIKSSLLIERLGNPPRFNALAALQHLRLRLMSAIDSRFNAKVGGTLKAMLTGNRYFLDRATVESLRESSTFHTLVIAGLHIGIIAWALLGGRTGLKRRRLSRVIACLLVLWAYAVMVGLAPPVTRATAMITIGLIGPLLFRRAASINTVALAAFGMLALKPALVADPGFQLSLAAVGGIVAMALPVARKLQAIGQWRPGSQTPHPPSCSRAVRYLAEALYWNERAFKHEMKRAPIRYRLRKASAARVLGTLRLQALLRGAVLLMITSAAIQLSTLPLMALYFNRVAPIGILLNVIAGLLTGFIMLSAVGAISVAGFSGVIAGVLVGVVNAAHYLLVNAITPFVDIPFATFRVAHYEGWQTIIYVSYFVPLAMLAVLLDLWHPVDQVTQVVRTTARGRNLTDPVTAHQRANTLVSTSPLRRVGLVLVCALALGASLIAVIKPPVKQPNGELTVYFLDVGQGDSEFIVFPRGRTMLVDGGGEIRIGKGEQMESDQREFADQGFSIGEAVVSRFIWSLGRTRVDYVLATHAHADHIGGLSDVVRSIEAREAVVGYAPPEDPGYQLFAQAALQQHVPIYSISAGERFEIDGVTVEVLWPPPATGRVVTSGNDDSVVLRLVYGSNAILLAGDIEANSEKSLVTSGVDLRADVLKVPHHGSKTSSTDAFVDAVHPKFAVISVGERSRFGHPHASVVNRYLAHGIELLQTGRDGMVTIETGGSTFDVKTYKKPGDSSPAGNH